MSAIIIDFAKARACRLVPAHCPSRFETAEADALKSEFMFWSGASGARYVHTVYPLVECPELPDANVLLVRRTPAGRAEVMHVGRIECGSASLNLAEVRHVAARLGVNEVHVHLLGKTCAEREGIERDLSGSGELALGAGH